MKYWRKKLNQIKWMILMNNRENYQNRQNKYKNQKINNWINDIQITLDINKITF